MKKLTVALALIICSCSNSKDDTPEPVDPLKKEKEMLTSKWSETRQVKKEVQKDLVTGAIIRIKQPDGSYADTVTVEKASAPGSYWDFRADKKLYTYREGVSGGMYYDTLDYVLTKTENTLLLSLDGTNPLSHINELTNSNAIISKSSSVITNGNTKTERIEQVYLKK